MRRRRDAGQVREIIETLKGETKRAKDLRVRLRRRTQRGDREREKEIEKQLRALARAMVPIRSELGRAIYRATAGGLEDQLRQASADAKYERQQLRKLLV